MKRVLFALLFLAACSNDPVDVPEADSADGGVAELARPLTVDSSLEVYFEINFDNPWDSGLAGALTDAGPVVPPIAQWQCPPFKIWMNQTRTRAGFPPDPPTHMGDQALSGPTAIVTEKIACVPGAGGVIKRCEYRFSRIGVDHRWPADILMIPDKGCGHRTPADSTPWTFFFPSGATNYTGFINVGGPFRNKAYWRDLECNSGCYACGSPWFQDNTSIKFRRCTQLPQGGVCVQPCMFVEQFWQG